MKASKKQEEDQISRKQAISKLGTYGKYAALTALGTYMILSPQKARATSVDDTCNGF
jgi:hypothetical protein